VIPIAGNPATIVQAGGIVCLLAAVAQGPALGAARLRSEAGVRWASANLLLGAAALATLARAHWPQPLVYAVADLCELLAYLQLQHGLGRFTRQPGGMVPSLSVVALAAAALPLLYADDATAARLLVYSGAAAWLLAQCARLALHGLRAEFGREAALAVAGPCAIGALLEVGRAAIALVDGVPDVADPLRPTTTNAMFQWAAFAIVVGLNFSLAIVSGARRLAQSREMTLRDALTGLWNRRAVELRLRRELAARARHGLPLALIAFDLDHFKLVNDRHGHAVGDAALRHVAQLLGPLCRDADVLARTGGEEFCVLMPYTALEGACLMAQRLRSTLEAHPLAWRGTTLALTGSFGAASVELIEDDGRDLAERADQAMYAAKHAGRNSVCAAPRKGDAPPLPAEHARPGLHGKSGRS
jgi:diguanylate cyclase (GGDEF)-like protein